MLITRPLDDAAATAARVEALGFRPVVAPVIEVRHFAPTLPATVQAILVTSGNALAGLAIPHTTLAHTKLLAVGDVTAALGRLTVPTAVVMGEWDLVVRPSSARTLAAAVPGAELVAVPAAGHFVARDAPGVLAAVVTRMARPVQA